MTRAVVTRVLGWAAVALTVVAVIALVATSGSTTRTYRVNVVLSDASNVIPGASVEVAGFPVGRVTSISVKLGGEPHLAMAIDDSYKVKQGVSASLRLGSLAGELNRYIELDNGSGPPVPAGYTIPVARTSTPAEVSEIISAFTPQTLESVSELESELDSTLLPHVNEFGATLAEAPTALDQVEDLLGQFNDDRDWLGVLIDRAAAGSEAVASQPAAFGALIDNLDAVLHTAASRQTQLAQSVALLPGALVPARMALTRVGSLLPVLSQLISTTKPVVPELYPLARALVRTAPVAIPVLDQISRLVRSFITNGPLLAGLLNAAGPTLTGLPVGLKRLGPAIDWFRVYTPDIAGLIANGDSTAANYGNNGHYLDIWLDRQFRPPQQPASDYECGTGWLLRPFVRVPGALVCQAWDYAKTFIEGGKPLQDYLTAAEQKPWPGEFSSP